MSDQPEALRLADALEELDGLFSSSGACGEAAAELRRLHGEVERLRDSAKRALEAFTASNDLLATMYLKMDAVTALRAALKEPK
jgi:hypothetical protein